MQVYKLLAFLIIKFVSCQLRKKLYQRMYKQYKSLINLYTYKWSIYFNSTLYIFQENADIYLNIRICCNFCYHCFSPCLSLRHPELGMSFCDFRNRAEGRWMKTTEIKYTFLLRRCIADRRYAARQIFREKVSYLCDENNVWKITKFTKRNIYFDSPRPLLKRRVCHTRESYIIKMILYSKGKSEVHFSSFFMDYINLLTL